MKASLCKPLPYIFFPDFYRYLWGCFRHSILRELESNLF